MVASGEAGCSGAAVSERERDRSKIDENNRPVLIGLIETLYRHGGLASVAQDWAEAVTSIALKVRLGLLFALMQGRYFVAVQAMPDEPEVNTWTYRRLAARCWAACAADLVFLR